MVTPSSDWGIIGRDGGRAGNDATCTGEKRGAAGPEGAKGRRNRFATKRGGGGGAKAMTGG